MEKKYKNIKVTFFITGQENKQNKIKTKCFFEKLWEDNFSLLDEKNPISMTKLISKNSQATTLTNKVFILDLHSYDKLNDFYFGYIGVFRNTVLPSVWNTVNNKGTNIALKNDDEILEKSYFIYYPSSDLLAFHQNHLGPRADDLAYVLSKKDIKNENISFSPVWKDSDMKSLLETGSILKKGIITLALPRNFDSSDLKLTNSWSEDIINMMSDSGMSKMTVNFWGRASRKKGASGYVSNLVKEGIAELLSKFNLGSERKNQPKIIKAEAQLINGETKSLLNQDLSTTKRIEVFNGYPKEESIKKAILDARDDKESELIKYIRK